MMICPKCSREIPGDQSVCDYCGFTFQTPRQNQDGGTAPYAAAPFAGPAFENHAPAAEPAQAPGYAPRTTVQTPPPAYQPSYQPNYAAYTERSRNEPLSIAQYIGMFLLNCIPLAGLIVMIVWASRSTNVNRRHFAAAALILRAIALVFVLGACIVFFVYNTPLFFLFFR